MIDTFWYEFTNWEYIFAAVTHSLGNQAFINELFELMKFVIRRLKDTNCPEVELLRSYAHHAIKWMYTQPGSVADNAKTFSYIFTSVASADRTFELITEVNKCRLKLCNLNLVGFRFGQIFSQF